MRIVMIGPVYPYKGGISHYTSLLCKSIRERHEVIMLSYSMQYPRILFRGEQKDPGNKSFQINDARFILHTANPFNWIKTSAQIRKLQPDLVIIQWWHPYFAPCYHFLAKRIRCPILFVCHNVLPHESFPMDAFLTRTVLRKGSFFIVHAKSETDVLKKIVPNAVFRVCSMPTFTGFSDGMERVEEARMKLSIPLNARVLLFFGLVRDYKGLDVLIHTLPRIIKDIPDIRLLIAGKFGKDRAKYEEMISNDNLRDYIEVYDQYVPDDQIATFYAASDLVVLPYKSATQSAVVQMAYGFCKPVVVTNVGGLPEAVIDGKTGYVIPSEDEAALHQTVVSFFSQNRAAEFEQNIRTAIQINTWDQITDLIESMCKTRR